MKNYFKKEEWECPCCHKDFHSHKLDRMLNLAREMAEVPFVLNSACRCSAHNKAIHGNPHSSHLNGKAVDISCTTSRARAKILYALGAIGFNRIGIAKNFIHADVDEDKVSDVYWMY